MDDGNSSKTIKITKLKEKQKSIEGSWGKTGNPKLIQFFIDIIPDLLNAERCSVFVYNPNSDSLWLYRGTDVQEGQIQVPRNASMAGETLSNGIHKIYTDLEHKAGTHEVIDLQTKFTTCNILSLPIFTRTGDQAIGVLQVLNKKSRDGYTKEDVELMYRLIDNIKRYIEPIFKHQEVAEILIKIKKKIKGLESSLAKEGIKQRLDEEQIASLRTQESRRQAGRLH
jgi:hypothetical protein